MTVQQRRLWILPLITLFLVQSAYAAPFFLEDTFNALGIQDFFTSYASNMGFALVIDFILILIFFITLFSKVADSTGKHIGKKPLVIFAVILAISFGIYESTTGFRLGQFSTIAVAVVVVSLVGMLFYLIKSYFPKGWAFSIAFVVGFTIYLVLRQMMGLDQMALFQNEPISTLHNVGMIVYAVAWLVLIAKVANTVKGGGTRGGTQGSGRSGSNFNVGNIRDIPGVGSVRAWRDSWRDNKMDQVTQEIDQLEKGMLSVAKKAEDQAAQIASVQAHDFEQIVRYVTHVIQLYEHSLSYEERLSNLVKQYGRVGGQQGEQIKQGIRSLFQQYHQITSRILATIERVLPEINHLLEQNHAQEEISEAERNKVVEIEGQLQKIQQGGEDIVKGLLTKEEKFKELPEEVKDLVKAFFSQGKRFVHDVHKLNRAQQNLRANLHGNKQHITDLKNELQAFGQTYLNKKASNWDLVSQRRSLRTSIAKTLERLRTNFDHMKGYINQKKQIEQQMQPLVQHADQLKTALGTYVRQAP
ncbi:MAG: hypothetical protein ACOCWQ_00415 [Nanoarchaeota archaeon]